MNKIYSSTIYFLLIFALAGCITPRKKSTNSRSKALQPKLNESIDSKTTDPDLSVVSNTNDKLDFVTAMTKEDPREIKPSDHIMFERISRKVAPDALDRAVMYLASIRTSMQMRLQARQFEEVDLFGKSTQKTTKNTQLKVESLEAQAQNFNVDVLKELKSNSLLQDRAVFELTVKVLEGERMQFKNDVLRVCLEKLKKWAEFYQYVSGIPIIEGDQEEVVIEDPTSVADIRLADLVLVESERLAARKDYQGAVKLAKSIQEQNPLYSSSQEKVVKFSNLAVLELRRKAALAFQNALPVTDLRIKQTYLQEAKTHLEAALSEYPGAEQLDKIKENLAVISKDLDNISDQMGGEEN